MPRNKEEVEAEKKRKMIKELQKGPDLSQFVEDKKKKYVSYAQGARIYSINYYSFVKLAKKAGANIQIKKKVVVDLDLVDKYVEENCEGEEEDNV